MRQLPDIEQNDGRRVGCGRVLSGLLIVLGLIYVSGFWGEAAFWLPRPLNGWGRAFRPAIWALLPERPWLWLGVHVIVGVAVPTGVLAMFSRRPIDVGMGFPNALGYRLMLAATAVSLPVGLFALQLYPPESDSGAPSTMEWCVLLSMVPEHFLLCGVFVAVLLPGRRLPDPVAVTPLQYRRIAGLLRWVGLAQPSDGAGFDRWLRWLGIERCHWAAVVGSAAMFAIVHVGKPGVELALSIPGGLVLAYMTLRTRSIWPGLVGHWAMNLVPRVLVMAMVRAS